MSAQLRIVVGAVGLAGHTLPALALSAELSRRGHRVLFHGYRRWQPLAESLGLDFAGDEDQIVSQLAPDTPVAELSRALAKSITAFGADVVVGDGLTMTPVIAAELLDIPRATLFPEVYPRTEAGMPFFSLGLVAPRTAAGRAAWRVARPLLARRLPSTRWLRGAEASLNRERAHLGLSPASGSDPAPPGALTLVATLPQLEYPRSWPARVRVTGPLSLDPDPREPEWPRGHGPLVLVAPSTVKDPDGRLLNLVAEALVDESVRLLITTSGAPRPKLGRLPRGVVVTDWVDYSRVMTEAALVICHGNHGTVVAALGAGTPVLVVPAMDDDAEHGARVTWAGVGAMVPSALCKAATLRAVVRRLLADPAYARRAQEIARWSELNPGKAAAADLVERLVEAGPG